MHHVPPNSPIHPLVTASLAALLAVLLAAPATPPLAAQDLLKPAEPAEGAAGPAPQAQFEKDLAEWKDVLKQLRTVQVRYQNAPVGQTDQMRERWDELMAEGERLLPKLRASAVQAYQADPGNLDVTNFLKAMAAADYERDMYEEVHQVAAPLLDSGMPATAEFCSQAAVAAFAVNDHERAVKYFRMAAQLGSISEDGLKHLGQLEEYKELWAEEQELRRKEAEQDLPRVLLKTSKGEIELELFENEAPETVANFIYLVEKGFYDGLTFHRVLKGFVVQGGCPEGTGRGGPGYRIFCECDQPNHRKHFRGSISMAHAGPDTGGSQFFFTLVPTGFLNGEHTVFGRVVDGMEVLGKITRRDPSKADATDNPDRILKAEVLRKDPDKKYLPHRVP